MKIKVKDLIGKQLDYAVAIREGFKFEWDNGAAWIYPNHFTGYLEAYKQGQARTLYNHGWSTHPNQAYQIIDRVGISVIRCDDDYGMDAQGFTTIERIPVWAATVGQEGTTTSTEHQSHAEMFQIYEDSVVYGPTALVAAMRAYLAHGHRNQWSFDPDFEIEIPEVLS